VQEDASNGREMKRASEIKDFYMGETSTISVLTCTQPHLK